MRRAPTDEEITQAAAQMGLLDESGKVPRNKRSLVAQTLINAVALDERQAVVTSRTDEFCSQITAIHNGLSNLPEATTAGVLAAVAPVIWRQSPTEGTAT